MLKQRWPEGFVCPHYSHEKGRRLKTQPRTYECAGCHQQTAVTARTVMHGSKTLANHPRPDIHRARGGVIDACGNDPEARVNYALPPALTWVTIIYPSSPIGRSNIRCRSSYFSRYSQSRYWVQY